MPVIKSAKKKLRKDKKRTLHNNKWRALLDGVIKKARKTPKAETIRVAMQLIDKSAKKHLIHKNKAARLKSALSKLITGASKAVKKEKAPTKTRLDSAKRASKKSSKK